MARARLGWPPSPTGAGTDRPTFSEPRVLAQFGQAVAQGHPKATGRLWRQVADQALSGPAQFLDGEDDPRPGVSVVVADGDRPADGREFLLLVMGRVVARVEGTVVDRSAHARSLAGRRPQRKSRQS